MDIASLYHIFQRHPQVTTDSRYCPEGAMFFALKGERFNGNAFAAKALESGCAYAVVDETAFADSADKRYILVDNVLQTLQQLANYHRRHVGTLIIGVTGTNGKTTTKELMATVLKQVHRVLYTEGNLNNAIGVPLTLLRLTPDHDIAVVEMGASHPGDIRELVEIAEPDMGIITNVGMAHLQGFGSFEGVMRTKGELYDFLRAKSGATVFINNDSPHLAAMADGLNLIRYGKPDDAAALRVSGEVVDCAPCLRFRWRMGNSAWREVQTNLIGSYNLDNMLAAAAVGLYFGVTPAQVDAALAGYVPQNNRSQLRETGHNHLIVDAYNANPTSMAAALNNFRSMEVAPKMVILGDMKELGTCSTTEHCKVVEQLQEAALERVCLVGQEFASAAFGKGTEFLLFDNVDQLCSELAKEQISGYYILIKGSNSMRLAQAAELL